MTTPPIKIAFLGLGAMGARMAARLIDAGFDLTVWNRDPGKAADLLAKGAKLAGTPAAAAMGAQFIISMVMDDPAARRVWLDPADGAINGLKSGAIAMECSTITPDWARELSSALAPLNVDLLDAPVAGSRPQADSGQLIFMVGGKASAFEAVAPVLAPMAAKSLHVGDIGQGAVLKLAVNTFFAAQLSSLAELLGFLEKAGIGALAGADLLAQFPVVAPPLAGAAKMMAAGITTPMFTVDLIAKDLGYVIAAASALGASTPTALASRGAFQSAQALGVGGENISALGKVYL
jgi:3-hydroxyisobutyrate dehydrogenase